MMRISRGFTLIEVMVVVAIVGVLAALALPRISALTEKRNSTTEIDTVFSSLVEIRDHAREARRCSHVTLPTSTSMQIDSLTLNANGSCSATIESTQTIQFNPHYVTITSFDITFDRHGGLDALVADSVDVTVNAHHDGLTEPHVLRIFKTLGLIRRLS